MTEEKKAECVLRLFGVPDAAVKEAAGGFSPQWKAEARWKSRGAETLVALSAQNPAGLKKAAQALREKFSADLYGAGETTLAEAAVQELERHDRLLICSDAAAGTLLEARLETIAGAERVFDFGALSYAHPKTGAKIEQQAAAHLPADTTDPVRRALAKAQAARRVVGCDLAAGCAEREGDCVLVLSCKKGCWLRTVPLADRPALWLLDMIRRAACDLPQAAGTGFLPARKAARTAQPEAAPPARRPRRARRVLVVLLVLAVLAALCTAGAWVYTAATSTRCPSACAPSGPTACRIRGRCYCNKRLLDPPSVTALPCQLPPRGSLDVPERCESLPR